MVIKKMYDYVVEIKHETHYYLERNPDKSVWWMDVVFYPDILSWLNESTAGSYMIFFNVIEFEDGTDAMAFKLRWS